jgi:hypothetical protein
MRLCRLARLAATLPAVLAASAASADQRLGDLTGPWQLFVDDHLIARRDGTVSRVYHAFEKYAGNPIMVADKPWEANVVACNAVLPAEDGAGYRMWYYCWAPKNDAKRSHALYATSRDGIHWDKPALGLMPWAVTGTLDNNFIAATGDVVHTPADPDPARRYKCLGGGGSYHMSASPDGIHWERLTREEMVKGGDTGTFLWDPFVNRFRGYVKVNATVSGLRRRSIGFSEGNEPDGWPRLRLIMAPDDIDDRWVAPGAIHRTHFYGCPMFAYQTAYIGLLWIFRADDEDGYFLGPVFNELVTSRDGVHWLREEGDRPRLLDVGPPGTWDSGMVYAAALVPHGEELRLYYTGASNLHDTPPFHGEIGLATIRRDGFVSLDAAYKPGTVTTRPLNGLAGRLRVNYRAWGGSLRVEALGPDGKPLAGYSAEECVPLQRDEVDATVAWTARRELPAGVGPLALRFLIDKGSLFSFAAGDRVTVADTPAAPVLGVLYTFEGDAARQVTDKLTADGTQPGRFAGKGKVDPDAKEAAFGTRSASVASPWRPLQRIEIPGTRQLGTRFSLALMARSADNKPARLFSAYNGNRPVNATELVFDCDPRGKALPGLRLICKGIPVESDAIDFADGRYHHLAVTYDDGCVRFYLDGRPAGEAWLPGGAPVNLTRDLMVGEDAELGSDEQLTGHVDDVLVLGRCLAPAEVSALASQGAEATLLR